MKRKVTELEKKLLADGWQLSIKAYKGKHSEKVDYYEYTKIFNETPSYIQITPSREKISDYGIISRSVVVNIYVLENIKDKINKLYEYVENLDNPPKEPINVPNSELDEKQELPPMTPEQFDELCEEIEKENKDAKGD